jgi:hypothetical protein
MQPPEQTSNQNKLPDSDTVQNFLINKLKLSNPIVSDLVNNEGGVSFAVTFDPTEKENQANKRITKMKPGDSYTFDPGSGSIIFIKNADGTMTCTADAAGISDIQAYPVPVENPEPKCPSGKYV